MKAIDHTMKNIDVVIMPNSSSFPCIECKVHHTNFHDLGDERTEAVLWENGSKVHRFCGLKMH